MSVTAEAPPALEDRILDAALVLVARWGVAKTSLGDIARQARCGRATLYRVFPGGKAHLFDALGKRELHRLLQALTPPLDEAGSLEDALVVAISTSASFATGHEALQFLLAHEPGLILPHLGFTKVEVVYRRASVLIGPHLMRFLDVDQTPWAVEWAIRLLVSYLINPAEGTNLTCEHDVRRLVRTYLVPALIPSVPVSTGS